MMMTWRRPEGKQEAREGEGIFQQEEAWMTIEQEDTILHPFILRQFLHNAASRRISQDGRSKNFHFGELGYLDFWEKFVEAVDYANESSRSKADVDYLGLLRANYEAYPLKPIDAPLHITEDRFRGAADRRVIEIPDVQFGLYSTGDLIYCECKQERVDLVSLLDACRRGYRIQEAMTDDGLL